MISNEKNPKKPLDFYCIFCDFITTNKKDYKRHTETTKHFVNVCQSKNPQNPPKNPKWVCECGKQYKDNSGLWRHKQKHPDCYIKCYEGLDDKSLVVKLLEQNQDLQRSLIEISKEKNISNIQTHTNSHNKTFNLQFFLNDTCKNAMNISDFVSSIKPQLTDLETTGRLGYVEGISNIILSNLKNLQIHDRPLHCSDFKREVFYIKDNDVWSKEDELKPILTKAIKHVANENIKNINEWRKEHPDCTQSDSKKNNTYLKIVSNSMSGSTKEECDKNIGKIINNIAKEVIIDKKLY